MGMYYEIKKENKDYANLREGKYGWELAELISEYKVESVNHRYDNCDARKRNKNTCKMCDCHDEAQYKITKDILEKIGEDHIYYELLKDVFDAAEQDYVWIEYSC